MVFISLALTAQGRASCAKIKISLYSTKWVLSIQKHKEVEEQICCISRNSLYPRFKKYMNNSLIITCV